MQRKIVIVGGSSGIGLACARLFLEEGDLVCNLSRTACPLPGVLSIPADVTDGGQMEDAFARIFEEWKRIDLLLYFAGFSMSAPTEYAAEADYRHLFEVNFFGALDTVRRALPLMKKRGGKVFFASSLAAVYPILCDSFYSASKAALDQLARELAMELKPLKISVTSVHIGGTRTRFTFKRKVYPGKSCGEYASVNAAASANLAAIEQGGMAPEAVAKHFLRLAGRRHPPAASAAGFGNKAVIFLKRLLPESALLRLNRFLLTR